MKTLVSFILAVILITALLQSTEVKAQSLSLVVGATSTINSEKNPTTMSLDGNFDEINFSVGYGCLPNSVSGFINYKIFNSSKFQTSLGVKIFVLDEENKVIYPAVNASVILKIKRLELSSSLSVSTGVKTISLKSSIKAFEDFNLYVKVTGANIRNHEQMIIPEAGLIVGF